MKVLIVWAIVLFAIMAFCHKIQDEQCGGKDRWDVKTLCDNDSRKIDSVIVISTVKQMRTLQTKRIGNTTPRFGDEFHIFQIDCKIREYKTEADGDYHLVMTDLNDSTITMIGEIADPYCQKTMRSEYLGKFIDSQASFQMVQRTAKYVQNSVYRITGVGFFDKLHGQLGVAPNGIELHPIIKFQKLK